MEFIEATAFTRQLLHYLQDDEYRSLQDALAENPQLGEVIQGTGGFRKMRWADQRRGKGKRGGLRVVYFYFEEDEQIWMLTVYGKDEAEAEAQRPQQRAKEGSTCGHNGRESRSQGKAQDRGEVWQEVTWPSATFSKK